MWHFGKGQAPHLGRPSIFITSQLVIRKLASPIFVSRRLPLPFASSPPFILFSPPVRVALLSFSTSWFNNATPFRLTCLFRGKENKDSHADAKRKTHEARGLRVLVRGPGERMSTPAVRIAATERRANTNVINTSALTAGTLCVSEFA